MVRIEPAKIGIVEDDPSVLRFFISVIESCGELKLAFAVATLAEARAAIAREAPDLCLVDLGLPDGDGLDLVRALKATRRAKALVTTVLGDRATVLKVLRAGADGYIVKSAGQADILTHIKSTLAGFTPVSPQVASYLLELLKPDGDPAKDADAPLLSPRETEVLSIFCRGLTYEETAHALDISVNTVRDFVRKIYAKLEVHSRSEAMFEARQLGLIDAGKRK
jgi:DNA-binding NarL/FixJ family response regulator